MTVIDRTAPYLAEVAPDDASERPAYMWAVGDQVLVDCRFCRVTIREETGGLVTVAFPGGSSLTVPAGEVAWTRTPVQQLERYRAAMRLTEAVLAPDAEPGILPGDRVRWHSSYGMRDVTGVVLDVHGGDAVVRPDGSRLTHTVAVADLWHAQEVTL